MNSRFACFHPLSEQDKGLWNRRKAPEPLEAAHTGVRDIPETPQAAGNLAVQQLFRSGAVQAKFAISQPGDVDEQEADRIADKVVTGTSGSVFQGNHGASQSDSLSLKRKAEQSLQPKAASGQGANATLTVQNQTPSQLGGRGQPLPESEKAFFESRLGCDFTHVRVHTDARAVESARAISALAYTIGRDIFFSEGRYAPHTESGKRLLAHELAHTVQQSNTRAERVQCSFLPGGSGDWHEAAQALTIIIAGLDLAAIAQQVAPIAIKEAGAYTTAGGDYGPQNALRHCIFAGLLDSRGWREAIAELAVGSFIAQPLFLLYGATLAARVRMVLWAHEEFADDGCGNFGTGTVDSECDQHNNEVGLSIGGPFTSDADIISEAKVALDGGKLWMTPGPTDLSRTVSTAGWRTSPWMAGGPQQPDCSYVTKK